MHQKEWVGMVFANQSLFGVGQPMMKPGKCAVDMYWSGNSSACTPCPADMFAPPGSPSCAPCAAGYFVGTPPGPHASACQPCAGDTFSGAGATACSPCADGTYAPPGAPSCAPCAVDSFIGTPSGPGASACQPCSPGRCTSAPGAIVCSPCTTGGRWMPGVDGWVDGPPIASAEGPYFCAGGSLEGLTTVRQNRRRLPPTECQTGRVPLILNLQSSWLLTSLRDAMPHLAKNLRAGMCDWPSAARGFLPWVCGLAPAACNGNRVPCGALVHRSPVYNIAIADWLLSGASYSPPGDHNISCGGKNPVCTVGSGAARLDSADGVLLDVFGLTTLENAPDAEITALLYPEARLRRAQQWALFGVGESQAYYRGGEDGSCASVLRVHLRCSNSRSCSQDCASIQCHIRTRVVLPVRACASSSGLVVNVCVLAGCGC